MTTFTLQKSKYIPKELQDGILYVSEEYKVAVHRCACGCGSKVTTPLGPAEWTFSEHGGLPSLSPSIGNWQLPCRSHYVIRSGRVLWAAQWSEEQVAAGRQREQRKREAYYRELDKKRGIWWAFWNWVRKLLGLR